MQSRLEATIHGIVEALNQPRDGALHTALLMSIPMVRGIGLDLSIGGDLRSHKGRYEAWRKFVVRSPLAQVESDAHAAST